VPDHANYTRTSGINWRRGAFRLWLVASGLWGVAALTVPLANTNVTWFPSASSGTVHIKISDTKTWDYPAAWGVQRIRDVLEKRLAAEDAKDREWAAQLPEARMAECKAIPPTTPFVDQPPDCVRLFFAAELGATSVVPSGWESQVKTASISAWSVIATTMPWAVRPPLVLLALGASLFWAFAGFRGELPKGR